MHSQGADAGVYGTSAQLLHRWTLNTPTWKAQGSPTTLLFHMSPKKDAGEAGTQEAQTKQNAASTKPGFHGISSNFL